MVRSMRPPFIAMRRAWLALVIACASSSGEQTYRRVTVEDGQLNIVMAGGREIPAARDSGQVAFDQVAIAPDQHSVGWLALYPNCCTTYPIPLKLVVLTDGKERTFSGNDLPVWRWAFSADGKRIAFRQSPVHGPAPVHYELWDIRNRHRMASFDTQTDTSPAVPTWARALQPER